MVFSCLVKPLVPSLIEGSTGRRTALTRRRFAATALMATALSLGTTAVDAQALKHGEVVAEKTAARSLHKKPAAIPMAHVVAQHALQRDDDALKAPQEAPRFEWHALAEHRLRHSRNHIRDPGSLGLGMGLARLSSPRRHAFQHFGSGRLLSGASSPL